MREVVRGIEALVAALERPRVEALSKPPQLSAGRRQRLESAVGEIEQGPFGHDLARRLGDFLSRAPAVDLRRIRPLVLAREWNVPAEAAIELCVAAQRAGLLAMRWAILCPRCRGAKSEVPSLHELPRGVHCESCNIDYERDFSQNVELVFDAAPWLRELPEGDFCMMGAASTPHVKVQRQVEPGGVVSEPLELPAGSYRLRTVEAGGQWEVDHDGGAFPEVVALGSAVEAGPPAAPGQVTLCNQSDRPLNIVVEERAWTADALTGPQVIAMHAFRELCPEQLLRPGDDVAIGRVTILFTDLKGSTALYAEIGDSTAYGLVRDHFAFLVERVRGHRGVLVKTMGDAVMAAFEEPADAVRAAFAMQRDVAAFNADHKGLAIVVKLGLHQGPCIAVTSGGILDYFGTTVNVAARLQGQSRGGDMVLSAEMIADPAVAGVLEGAELQPESAVLHGIAEAVTFYRLTSPGDLASGPD
jgi:class 3 adenylate cyclase